MQEELNWLRIKIVRYSDGFSQLRLSVLFSRYYLVYKEQYCTSRNLHKTTLVLTKLTKITRRKLFEISSLDVQQNLSLAVLCNTTRWGNFVHFPISRAA